MDFSYIHEHPWITAGAILGGGFVLYLILHKRSTAGTDAGSTVYYSGTTQQDPNAAAYAAQQQQTQAALAALSLQGQTQIGLANIGAGLQSQTVTASQEVQDRQIDAQKDLGMGTLGAQVQLAQIQANTQMSYIDAIIQAFTGNHPVTNPTPVNSTPVYNSTGNPVYTVNPPQTYNVTTPTYTPSGTSTVYDGSETSYFQAHPTTTWSQYYADYQTAHGYTAGTSYDPAAVAQQTQLWADAYEQWKADPYSPRNTAPTGWVNG